mgnify:CR=1 FL=1
MGNAIIDAARLIVGGGTTNQISKDVKKLAQQHLNPLEKKPSLRPLGKRLLKKHLLNQKLIRINEYYIQRKSVINRGLYFFP